MLSKAGYQTHLVGKLHLWPKRKLYGFHSADWSDGPYPGADLGDYGPYLQEQGIHNADACLAHGAALNSWVVRPWHLDEQLHFSNWCADRALRFLERRDPTVPFFLNVSLYHPHPPFTPPDFYLQRYLNMDLPEPCVGDWARIFEQPQRGLPTNAPRIALEPHLLKQYLAGYYACINHVDDQIARILWRLDDPTGKAEWNMPDNTLVLFVSDHGEMLGDHQWNKKCQAFEGSARIPFLIRFPKSMGIPAEQVRDEVVELMDVMPTILDLANVPIPETVDGSSVMPLIRGETNQWRDYLHGECAHPNGLESGMQYLTDGRWKYIWYPGTGDEQLFDLEHDPQELEDLSRDTRFRIDIAEWRTRLAHELAGRPEEFSDGLNLKTVGGLTPYYLPGYERKDEYRS
jgi:arylsulfatase A-like enzyme